MRSAWCFLGLVRRKLPGDERRGKRRAGGLGCDGDTWLGPLCVFALSFVVVARRGCRARLVREERYPVRS